MMTKLNRRDFLAGAPVAAAGLGLLATVLAQAAAKPAPPTARTVSLMGDSAPVTAVERLQQLHRLVEKTPAADDKYLKGGAVEALEAAMGAMLGKEDAAFMPTGTLANNLAVRLL